MSNLTKLENLIKESLKGGEEKMTNKPSFNKLKLRLRSDKTDNPYSASKRLIYKPSAMIAILTIILTIGFTFGIYAKDMLRTDKIDYPFVNEPSIIGKWQTVDFVKDFNAFNPTSKSWGGALYIKEMAFLGGGKVLVSINEGNKSLAPTDLEWTKGLVINPLSKTASKYTIKDINGTSYLFYEWKSGDYTIRGMNPNYYVLKRIDSNDYSSYNPQRNIDKTDYSFEKDPQIVGEWKVVDFVDKVEVYNPERVNFQYNLYLKKLSFDKDGRVNLIKTDGTKAISWTKGLILDKVSQTASKYEIKEIIGDTYMFYEWKSGDYVYRGLQPQYYVLKKVK